MVEQLFIDGDYTEAATITIPFKNGLKKGEYLIMYQSEFTDLHPFRKLVLSVYCEDKT